MTIDLYAFPPSPPCRAVLMTAKELSIDVNIKYTDVRAANEQLTQHFIKMNPAHTVPTIVDGDLILWESRAIMQYLVNKYAPNSPLYPTEPKKRAIVDRTLNTDQTMFTNIREGLVFKYMRSREPTEQQIQSYKNSLKLMDALIGDHKYVTGDELTIADFSVLATTSMLIFNDYKDLNDCPKLKTWFERMQKELPYYEEITDPSKQLFKQLKAKNKRLI